MIKDLFNFIFASTTPKSSSRNRKRSRNKNAGPERISGASFAPADGGGTGQPKVLVADIAGDTSGEVAARIATSLDGFQTCEIFRTKRTLKLGDKGALVDKLIAAADEGRNWMASEEADLLIWGQITRGMIELRFLPMRPAPESQPGAFGLGDVLILPRTFSGDLDSVLHATVLGAVGPTFKGMRIRIGIQLDQALSQTRPVLEQKPADMGGTDYTTLVACLGNAFAAHALLGGPEKRLDQAASAYKIALSHTTAAADPINWSLTQNHLGTALKVKGERAKDEDILKQASIAFKAIANELSRVAFPFDWALANINLGLVLYRLGTLTSKSAYYQEATKAFDEALTVYSKDTTPGKWAEVCNQYGVVLLALGEQVNGNTTLEIAIKKFRAALHIRKKEIVPGLWAQTANNLGAACFSLAKRNSEIALLREASSCFEGAVEIYARSGAAKKAEVITNNLSRVQRLLSTREGA